MALRLRDGLGYTARPARDFFYGKAARFTSPNDDSLPIHEKCVRERCDSEYLLELLITSCADMVGEPYFREEGFNDSA